MSDIAQKNKAIVEEIFEKIVNGGDADLAAKFYKEDYIQHNPNVPQGLAGLQGLIRGMHAMWPNVKCDVKLINAEGDMVWLLCQWSGNEPSDGSPRLSHTAEIFRVENGMMAEHWDVLQYEQKG